MDTISGPGTKSGNLYHTKILRFAAFLMCFDVPLDSVIPDPRGKPYFVFVFRVSNEEASRFWMGYQNRISDFKVDAKRYAEEFENLKSETHPPAKRS